MGDWTLIVSGSGSHHNRSANGGIGFPEDADVRLLEFVDQLCADGHTLRHASIVYGAADTIEFEWSTTDKGYLRMRPVALVRDGQEKQDAEHLLAAHYALQSNSSTCSCGGACGCNDDPNADICEACQ